MEEKPAEGGSGTGFSSFVYLLLQPWSRKKFSKINVLLAFLCYLLFPSQTPTHLGEAVYCFLYVFAKAST
jgi:hypothetical protein